MKRKFLFVSILAISASLFAQTTANKSVIEIPKDYKKGNIVSANLNASNQLEIILALKQKKEIKMLQRKFTPIFASIVMLIEYSEHFRQKVWARIIN